MADHAAATVTEEPAEAVLPERRKHEKRKPKKQPRYNVVLWNDDDHTYAYVITMLLELFAHPVEKGYQMAQRSRHASALDRFDHDHGACRVEARSNPRLRQGRLDRRVPRIDVGVDRTVEE